MPQHLPSNWPRRLSSHVTSASKHTIQRVTDGLFESVVKEVHQRFPFIQHKVELFDALLAKVIISPQDYRVVLVLNEYGDFLSDMASGLMGSLGTAASGNYAFNHDSSIALAMFDPAGGTAPDIAGKTCVTRRHISCFQHVAGSYRKARSWRPASLRCYTSVK